MRRISLVVIIAVVCVVAQRELEAAKLEVEQAREFMERRRRTAMPGMRR